MEVSIDKSQIIAWTITVTVTITITVVSIAEQTYTIKRMVCSISIFKSITDLGGHAQKYNKLSGCMERCSGCNTTRWVTLEMHCETRCIRVVWC
jgi:hypothetical protein